MGDTDAAALDVLAGYAGIAGVRPSSDAINSDVLSTLGGAAYTGVENLTFCPTAILSFDVTITDVIFPSSA